MAFLFGKSKNKKDKKERNDKSKSPTPAKEPEVQPSPIQAEEKVLLVDVSEASGFALEPRAYWYCIVRIPGRSNTLRTPAQRGEKCSFRGALAGFTDGDAIEFEMKYTLSQQPADDDESLGTFTLDMSNFTGPEGYAGELRDDEQGNATGTLQVKVVPARRMAVLLIGAQLNADGKSDPYCVCEVPGRPETRVQTKVVKDTQEPEWNFRFHVDVGEADTLHFEVYNYDWPKSDDKFGTADLDSGQFQEIGYDGDLPLQNSRVDGAYLKLNISKMNPGEADRDMGPTAEAQRAAATKLQAIQRGRMDRREVQAIKDAEEAEREEAGDSTQGGEDGAAAGNGEDVQEEPKEEPKLPEMPVRETDEPQKLLMCFSSPPKRRPLDYAKRFEAELRRSLRTLQCPNLNELTLKVHECGCLAELVGPYDALREVVHAPGFRNFSVFDRSVVDCRDSLQPPRATGLEIKIIGAENLKGTADNMPNPYAICEVGGKQVCKTQPDISTIDPQWNLEVEIAEVSASDSIVFIVKDQKDSLLGKVQMDAKMFNPTGFEGECVLAFSGRGKKAKFIVKVLPVPIGGKPKPAVKPKPTGPWVWMINFLGAKCERVAHKKAKQEMADKRKNRMDMSESSTETHVLTLATENMEDNPWHKMDTYAMCEVSGKPNTKIVTRVIHDAFAPEWSEEYMVRNLADGDSLAFTVMDYEPPPETDKVLGKASLPYEFFKEEGWEGHLDLEQAGNGVTAHLNLRISMLEVDKAKQAELLLLSEESYEEHLAMKRPKQKVRITPGELLRPDHRNVFTRLYKDHDDRACKLKAKKEQYLEARYQVIEELRTKNQITAPWSDIDMSCKRLYEEGNLRQQRRDVWWEERKRRQDEEMVGMPTVNDYGERGEEEGGPRWEKLNAMHDKLLTKKLDKKAELDAKEQAYLDENSVHQNAVENVEEPVHEKLFGLAYQRDQLRAEQKLLAEQEARGDQVTRVAETLEEAEQVLEEKTNSLYEDAARRRAKLEAKKKAFEDKMVAMRSPKTKEEPKKGAPRHNMLYEDSLRRNEKQKITLERQKDHEKRTLFENQIHNSMNLRNNMPRNERAVKNIFEQLYSPPMRTLMLGGQTPTPSKDQRLLEEPELQLEEEEPEEDRSRHHHHHRHHDKKEKEHHHHHHHDKHEKKEKDASRRERTPPPMSSRGRQNNGATETPPRSPRTRSEPGGRSAPTGGSRVDGKGRSKGKGKGKARTDSPGHRRFVQDYGYGNAGKTLEKFGGKMPETEQQRASDFLRAHRQDEADHYSLTGWHPAYRNSTLMKFDPSMRPKIEADIEFRDQMYAEPVQDREFCTKCDTLFVPDSSFCRRCGARREVGGPAPSPQKKTAPPPGTLDQTRRKSTGDSTAGAAFRAASEPGLVRQRRTIAGGSVQAFAKEGGVKALEAELRPRNATPSQTTKRKTMASSAKDVRASLLRHIPQDKLIGDDLRRNSMVINTPVDEEDPEADGYIPEFTGKWDNRPLRMRASDHFVYEHIPKVSEYIMLDPAAVVALQRPRERKFMLLLEGNIIKAMENEDIVRIELTTPINAEFRYLVHSIADYYGLKREVERVAGEKNKASMTLLRTPLSRIPDQTLEMMCRKEGLAFPRNHGSIVELGVVLQDENGEVIVGETALDEGAGGEQEGRADNEEGVEGGIEGGNPDEQDAAARKIQGAFRKRQAARPPGNDDAPADAQAPDIMPGEDPVDGEAAAWGTVEKEEQEAPADAPAAWGAEVAKSPRPSTGSKTSKRPSNASIPKSPPKSPKSNELAVPEARKSARPSQMSTTSKKDVKKSVRMSSVSKTSKTVA